MNLGDTFLRVFIGKVGGNVSFFFFDKDNTLITKYHMPVLNIQS